MPLQSNMKLFLLALFCLLTPIRAKHFLVEVDDITEETKSELMGTVDGGYKDDGGNEEVYSIYLHLFALFFLFSFPFLMLKTFP